jgi:hypothetical protein
MAAVYGTYADYSDDKSKTVHTVHKERLLEANHVHSSISSFPDRICGEGATI